MKRSEALRVIWEAIYELEDANYILKKLEDAGMLPPDRSSCNCQECGGPNHTWDDDNDVEFDPATDKNWRERYGKD